jgi:hypothetical protein
MSIKYGIAAIQHLALMQSETDPEASSHWLHYHKDFQFDIQHGQFFGVIGFGGLAPRYTGLRRLVHLGFQYRYRHMASDFPSFPDVDAAAQIVTNSQSRAYDLDVLRQSLTLSWLETVAPTWYRETVQDTCVIGDGFASLTSLLLATRRAKRVILVNLDKTLLADLWFLRLWMGDKYFERSVAYVDSGDDLSLLTDETRVVALSARHHYLVREMSVDTAYNIASMQEMNPKTIEGYFEDLRVLSKRKQVLFYCCNRVEKTLPDGVVTSFGSYPWAYGDLVLADELCPWHQDYYAPRFPFYFKYDGPIRHRLTLLAGS